MPGPMVEVTIGDGGKVSVHVVGAKGPSCKKHVDAFKNLGTTLNEGKKPEYNQVEPNRNLVKASVRNG